MSLVERTEGAEALIVTPAGGIRRSSGFLRLERAREVQQPAASNWPAGYEVVIALTLTTPDPRLDRSYMAFWVEDPAGKMVRTIVLWGNKAEYHSEMFGFWGATGGNKDLIYKVTRATRSPGSYKVTWNGLDDSGRPVSKGTYRVTVESNRWRGVHAKASGLIACGDSPSSISLEGSVNYGPITIQYGPKSAQA
jgi:hypothetical protein